MSSFVTILQHMVECVPGAIGAIFVDWEGEPVGYYALDVPELDIQIFGAQWSVVWKATQKALSRVKLGHIMELIIDGDHGSVLVRQVVDHYYVVLSMKRGTHLAKAMLALDDGVQALLAEM